jgi:hypothetical protein
MTIKRRIRRLERVAPEQAANEMSLVNFAEQLRQARLRVGLPERSKVLTEREPD